MKPKLALHIGRRAGSVCNRLTRQLYAPLKVKLNAIKFEEQEEKIDAVSFDEFYQSCLADETLIREW